MSSNEPAPIAAIPKDFAALVDALGAANYVNLEATLCDVMRVAEYAPPLLAYQLSGPVSPGFFAELREALSKVTGLKWDIIERSGVNAAPTISEAERAHSDADKKAIMESPLVKAAFAAFPDAELLDSNAISEKRSVNA